MNLRMTLKWCVPAECWLCDITDQEGNRIVSSIALVTGADLLEQYGYLRLGGQMIVQTDNDVDAVPTFDNLGSRAHLIFLGP